MNSEKPAAITGLFIVIILTISLFFISDQRDSAKKETHNFQQQAVEKGFAQWIVKGYNDTEFKWKE